LHRIAGSPLSHYQVARPKTDDSASSGQSARLSGVEIRALDRWASLPIARDCAGSFPVLARPRCSFHPTLPRRMTRPRDLGPRSQPTLPRFRSFRQRPSRRSLISELRGRPGMSAIDTTSPFKPGRTNARFPTHLLNRALRRAYSPRRHRSARLADHPCSLFAVSAILRPW
jgi:hypothetical protein